MDAATPGSRPHTLTVVACAQLRALLRCPVYGARLSPSAPADRASPRVLPRGLARRRRPREVERKPPVPAHSRRGRRAAPIVAAGGPPVKSPGRAPMRRSGDEGTIRRRRGLIGDWVLQRRTESAAPTAPSGAAWRPTAVSRAGSEIAGGIVSAQQYHGHFARRKRSAIMRQVVRAANRTSRAARRSAGRPAPRRLRWGSLPQEEGARP